MNEAAISRLVSEAGITDNAELIADIIGSALGLGADKADRLDLKITRSAVAEMREAFRVFAPFEAAPKVTVFGSARTRDDDPLYLQAAQLATAFAAAGWIVVTGAGPGIMHAAAEGAGRDHTIGVSIRLPFEATASALFDGSANHVAMKYFFTRKLMLVKESKGFVCLPGGFGTLDETLELITLQQTGKSEPAPIVLLDVPGGTFWHGFRAYVDAELLDAGYVSSGDLDRVLITDSPDAALAEVIGFWQNYHSLRWVEGDLVVRLRAAPTDADLAALTAQFGDALVTGEITRSAPLPAEQSDPATLDLPRIAMRWNPYRVGDLHRLIRAVNLLAGAGAI